MHPFDFPVDTKVLSGSELDYYNFVDQTYFNFCYDACVLEIGSYSGHHSTLIVQHKPKKFDVIEGDITHLDTLKSISGINSITINDAWLEINKPNPYDIVICFGVLYHHHSALHLLELIINYNKPKYIMLDCVHAEHPLAYQLEIVNTPGNRQTIDSWKQSGYNLKTPFFIVNNSLSNMGYQLEQVHKLNFDFFPKSNGWVALWKVI